MHTKKLYRSGSGMGAMLLFVPMVALAQLSPPASLKQIGAGFLWMVVLCGVAYWVFRIALVVGVIMAVMGAYKYMTSGGDTSKVSEAHHTLTYAAVGIGVAILAGSFPTLLISFLQSGTYQEVCPP